MSTKILRYSRNDFLEWALAICRDHPEISDALMHIHDGLCYDDVIEVQVDAEAPDFATLQILHGEEVD